MILFRSPLRALFLLALLAAGIWATATIRFQTELLPILPPQLPSVRGLVAFAGLVSAENEVIVVTDPSLPEDGRAALLSRLAPRLAALPGVSSVTPLGGEWAAHPEISLAWALFNAPPEVFSRFVAALGPENIRGRLHSIPSLLSGAIDPADLVRLQLDPLGLSVALSDGADRAIPDIAGPISGDDHFSGALKVAFAAPLHTFGDCEDATRRVRGVLDSTLDEGGLEHVLLTGHPVFTAEIARQMKHDMAIMIAATAALMIAAFWLFYRTLRPLGWILLFQALSLLCGILAARLFFGELNVLSIGFASILLGVSMDYCILVYHHFASPHRDDTGIWRTLRRGIWFSAATTSASFLILACSHFPALRQLSVLVGVGLLTTALFATWLLRVVLQANPPEAPAILAIASDGAAAWLTRHRSTIVALVIVGSLAALISRPWLHTGDFYRDNLDLLRPVGTGAYTGEQWLERSDPASTDAIYILRGPDHDAIRAALPEMAAAVSGGKIAPSGQAIASPHNQRLNASIWAPSIPARAQAAFDAAGLGPEWSGPTLALLHKLDSAARREPGAFDAIRDILRAFGARAPDGSALAVVRLPDAAEHPIPDGGFRLSDLAVEILPVSWISLQDEITRQAREDLARLAGWMLLAIAALCALAQRSLRLVLLNFCALALSLGIFALLLRLTAMRLTPLSLLCLPLLLGLVIDYSLHILMALEHEAGDLRRTYRHIAAPVLLTGLSSCIGFGAPLLTGQPALSNFGLAMDLGIIAAVSACLVLLPPIYLVCTARDYRHNAFYRLLYTGVGFRLIVIGWRVLGKHGAFLLSRSLALIYGLTHPGPTAAVKHNLALLDPASATWGAVMRLLFNQSANFAEFGGLALRDPDRVTELIGERVGLEHLERAKAGNKGCLLVTGHLGFFELGGLVMTRLGYPVTALTLPEPSPELTAWRARFRARWGVRTIVVGKDAFSVIEIARALREGSFVALLADRPQDENAVLVDLPHGRIPFASGPVLIALLAGCPIVPTVVVRQPDGLYHIEALPPIEPVWLPAGREATLEHYTREVAKALTPLLVRYREQWYQFSKLDAAQPTIG